MKQPSVRRQPNQDSNRGKTKALHSSFLSAIVKRKAVKSRARNASTKGERLPNRKDKISMIPVDRSE